MKLRNGSKVSSNGVGHFREANICAGELVDLWVTQCYTVT
jgi:hypothetical protein